jgi:hypothetical protein
VPDVASDELAERLVPLQVPWRAYPFVEQDDELVAAVRRAEDRHALETEPPQQVVGPLRHTEQSRLVPRGDQGGTRRRATPGQQALGDGAGPGHHGVVDAQLGSSATRRGDRAGGRQGEDPAEIFGGDEVQGAAHRPGPDDGPVVERGSHVVAGMGTGGAKTDRQQRCAQVLGLHGGQSAHGRDRGRRSCGDELRAKAQETDRGHRTTDAPVTGRDGSLDRALLREAVEQAADLGLAVPAVTAEGADRRELARLRPSGDGLRVHPEE